MSGARLNDHDVEGEQIFALARGFNALLEITQKLTYQERQLRDRLQLAHDEYLKLANQLGQSPNDRHDDSNSIAHRILHGESSKRVGSEETHNVKCWIREVEDSGYITGSGITALVEGVDVYESIAEQLSRKDDHRAPNDCVAAADTQSRASIERDFTTNGITGKLQCPFAKADESHPAVGEIEDGAFEACGRDELDPIKAESIAPLSGQSAARADVAARCPIRYLDNHSPEAIAKYFENHKHEIPRSHAVCIQRYQRDSQSRRFLDEKYGDLASMVKGLGKYHQAYLSSTHEGHTETQHGPQGADVSSASRVEKWAKGVGQRSEKDAEDDQFVDGGEAAGEDERANHFDRSLRDVRVGESPSRPWGIHVPVPGHTIHSSAPPPALADFPSREALDDSFGDNKSSAHHFSMENSKVNERSQPAATGRCPFHIDSVLSNNKEPNSHDKLQPSLSHQPRATEEIKDNTQLHSHPTPDQKRSSDPAHGEPQPRVVFNGPVFFGYDSQAAASLLDQIGKPTNAR